MTMLAHDANGATAPVIYPGASQDVTFGAETAQSNPVGDETSVIRVLALGGTCRIVIGENPVATSTSTPVIQNVPEYFAVNPTDKVAVIGESGATGALNITEGANHL